MSITRRTALGSLLGLRVAGAGTALLGATSAQAVVTPQGAPTERFAIGVRDFDWYRGNSHLHTRIFYPMSGGTPGAGVPVLRPDAEHVPGLGALEPVLRRRRTRPPVLRRDQHRNQVGVRFGLRPPHRPDRCVPAGGRAGRAPHLALPAHHLVSGGTA